ncbi:unnamed protein product, partial [Vitis vinifera]
MQNDVIHQKLDVQSNYHLGSCNRSELPIHQSQLQSTNIKRRREFGIRGQWRQTFASWLPWHIPPERICRLGFMWSRPLLIFNILMISAPPLRLM